MGSKRSFAYMLKNSHWRSHKCLWIKNSMPNDTDYHTNFPSYIPPSTIQSIHSLIPYRKFDAFIEVIDNKIATGKGFKPNDKAFFVNSWEAFRLNKDFARPANQIKCKSTQWRKIMMKMEKIDGNTKEE